MAFVTVRQQVMPKLEQHEPTLISRGETPTVLRIWKLCDFCTTVVSVVSDVCSQLKALALKPSRNKAKRARHRNLIIHRRK